MKYANRLKGNVTQALVRSLLIDAGITVVPLGIEDVIREVCQFSRARYLALNLPDSLRKLPDFFALNNNETQSWLIEVKFRKTWSEKVKMGLAEQLKEQVKTWNPLFVIIFLGEALVPNPNYDNPSLWLRVAKLSVINDELHLETKGVQRLWSESRWTDLSRIQDVFPELDHRDKWSSKVIRATLCVSKGLVSISSVENSDNGNSR